MKTRSEAAETTPAGRRETPRPARLPELLAPAGDWDCARAAVENGADGIYFGLERFNARMRARNFTAADLPELMTFLHRRGVKGYVTFNTLVFAEELSEAAQFLRAIIQAGADAAIIQDVGMARLIRSLSPDFPMHASTQMTVTSAAGARFVRELGCERVILARECSLADLARIREELAAEGGPELEVFVHGALCVAYSGQCLTSEALGGRSANRGECAQACRMPFDLFSDGAPVPLGDRRYLLSPQDLAAVDLLPEIVALGVASIKIEGRLKAPEYVANISRIYRQALDRIAANTGAAASAQDRYEMEMTFSRGLHTGWLRGIDNQALVHARFGKKRGVCLGRVSRVQRDSVVLSLDGPLKPGDGVVFDAGRPDQKEEGGRVYEVRRRQRPGAPDGPDEVTLTFGRGDIDFSRVHAGDRLWKTSDPELDRRIRRSYAAEHPQSFRPLAMEVSGAAGQPMVLSVEDELGNAVRVESALPLETARKQPLTEARLRDQLGRLGGTPFALGELRCRLAGEVLLPVSELNRLRREAVARIEALRARPARWTLAPPAPDGPGLFARPVSTEETAPAPAQPELIVLVRNLAQMEAALRAGVATLYCEFEDLKKYREAVRLFRQGQAGAADAASIFVAPPRIAKPGEEWILKQALSSEADGYLARNYDHLTFFAGHRMIGDFSLNTANPLTAEHLIRRAGLERVTASYDLNAEQLAGLLQAAPPSWFEITLHQHMPLFHMEHCVFCAFLSKGTDYTNCGRPCDRHEVDLRDRVGARHPVKADAGCRNTVYNALAQTGAEFAGRFIELGARRFRIELLNESPAQAAQTIAMYQRLLRGEVSGARLWRELKLVNRLGVTRGQMEMADARVPRWGEIEW